MLETIRKHLLTWLNEPLTRHPEVNLHDLNVLKNRMDTLERMIMTQIQRPDEGTGLVSPTSDRDIAALPDAHLGAQ
jgi:hypothetical protein